MPAGGPPPLEKRCLEGAALRANPTLVDVCTILPRNTEAEGVRQGWFPDLTTADANVLVCGIPRMLIVVPDVKNRLRLRNFSC